MILLLILIILVTIIGAFGSLYLKKGSKDFNLNIIKQLKNKNLIMGLIFFVFSTILYIFTLSLGDLGMLYPLTSFTFIWVSLLSIKFLGEKMNKYKWAGIAFIVIGAVLINGGL